MSGRYEGDFYVDDSDRPRWRLPEVLTAATGDFGQTRRVALRTHRPAEPARWMLREITKRKAIWCDTDEPMGERRTTTTPVTEVAQVRVVGPWEDVQDTLI